MVTYVQSFWSAKSEANYTYFLHEIDGLVTKYFTRYSSDSDAIVTNLYAAQFWLTTQHDNYFYFLEFAVSFLEDSLTISVGEQSCTNPTTNCDWSDKPVFLLPQ